MRQHTGAALEPGPSCGLHAIWAAAIEGRGAAGVDGVAARVTRSLGGRDAVGTATELGVLAHGA